MTPDDKQMAAIRNFGLTLLKKWVPFKRDDEAYKQVVSATGWSKVHEEHTEYLNPDDNTKLRSPDATHKKQVIVVDKDTGTTCGFLCHWLMWSLGVQNPKILNRFDKDRKTTYDNGGNIAKLFRDIKSKDKMATRHPQFFSVEPGLGHVNQLELGGDVGLIGPKPCDIVYMAKQTNGAYTHEHVFVFKGSRFGLPAEGYTHTQTPKKKSPADNALAWVWETAESGQKGGTDADHKKRVVQFAGNKMKFTNITSGGFGEEAYGIRSIIGWLPLDKLDYDGDWVNDIVSGKRQPLGPTEKAAVPTG